ncbi:radical SAM protein [Haloarchaeobius sp. HME9146]|uniref:radical SAM protein n=1 Tax=Haloarchaeobius sp. HME9146 TaxID=2978732 RepID=UPI0021BFB529|nr:radical SAM protein [Haloarchaeobius sp. HME9146]MCT9095300.1 radical SAM protein [Haloarchaeobius sp. HME9146]
MRRRIFISNLAGAGAISLAGCTGSETDGDTSENPTESEAPESQKTSTSPSTQTETSKDFDSGVIVDETVENPIEEQLTLSKGQTVAVTAEKVDDGEELFWTVGDGTKFVVREHFYEDTTKEYTVESDGYHNLRLSPKRHEAPMNKDVAIDVKVEISQA